VARNVHRNAMSYTLASAATATGLNRTTILRAIKSGKISGAKNKANGKSSRPNCPRLPARCTHRSPPRCNATIRTPAEDVELRICATLAEARLADLKATLDDMRSQRDHWQAMAQRLAIADQRTPSTPSQSRPVWWQRLAGLTPAAVFK
jgi:hypothetical protein